MSALCDELRPMWLPGINKISGRPIRGIVGLVATQDYQIYSPASPTAVQLTFSKWEDVVSAFATDCARMSTAALETVEGISPSTVFPKSACWLIVRGYYAAFFSAHAILRMFGSGLTQIDALTANALDEVSEVFGMRHVGPFQRGLYVCATDHGTRTLTLSKITADGSHEALWVEFTRVLKSAIAMILGQAGATPSAQTAAAKLTELQNALSGGDAGGRGNWLSVMRNRVNYQQALGLWFPYAERQNYYDGLFERMSAWQEPPESLSIWPTADRDVQQFVEACAMLLSLCRDLLIDMSRRCPSGKSFLDATAISFMRRLGLVR